MDNRFSSSKDMPCLSHATKEISTVLTPIRNVTLHIGPCYIQGMLHIGPLWGNSILITPNTIQQTSSQ